MATANKKSAAKRSSGKKQKNDRFGDSALDGVILILVMVLSVFVFLSLFSDATGAVGQAVSLLLLGLFGVGAYLLPALVLLFCLWVLLSKDRFLTGFKVAGGILLLLSVAGLVHTFHTTVYQASFFKLYQAGAADNGGAFGGLLSLALLRGLGKLGTYLVLLALVVVSYIFITGFSMFRFARERKQRKNARIKQRAERIQKEEELAVAREEARRQKEEEKAARDRQRAAHAEERKDMFNVKLNPSAKPEKTPRFIKMFQNNDESGQKAEKPPEAVPAAAVSPVSADPEPVVTSVPVRQPEPAAPAVSQPEAEEPPVILLKSAYDEKEGMVLNGDLSAVNTPEALPTSAALKKAAKPGENVQERLETTVEGAERHYQFPPLDLLKRGGASQDPSAKTEMLTTAKKLEETLKSFGVEARVVQINKGPTVTRYELTPSQGVKVSRIVNLADDIALNLAASGIRIEAPIPGKAAVGIEVPNQEPQPVFLRDVLESDAFQKFPSKVAFALGEDIAGKAVVTDIAKMPHLLIAGATGSGKSVCINTLITSILYKATPQEVKLLMIDPKVVELSVYNGIPHLLLPVVSDPKKAAGTLNWAVREMLQRYNDFVVYNVRDFAGYNAKKRERGETDLMPQIVIIIDELADLMMAAPKEVEDSICRLAQMARAAGMHLIIATQRPSVDVITGLIKANIPSRLAFAVSSGVDSRTILDMVGAEKLLGKGDMLFYPVGMSKPVRIQGAFVSDGEVEKLVAFAKNGRETEYDPELIEKMTSAAKAGPGTENGGDGDGEDSDEFFADAARLVVGKDKASVSMLQRQFRIGFNRAARLMDELATAGVVGPEEGSKPRKVKMSAGELEEYLANR